MEDNSTRESEEEEEEGKKEKEEEGATAESCSKRDDKAGNRIDMCVVDTILCCGQRMLYDCSL